MHRRRVIRQEDISSVNLHDISTDIENTYLGGNGNLISYNGWASSDFIPVTTGQYIYISIAGESLHSSFNFMYDENKTMIGNFNTIAKKNISSTVIYIPEKVKYIRFSNDVPTMEKFELYRLEE